MSLFRRPAAAVGVPFSIYMLRPREVVRNFKTLVRNPRYFSARVAVMIDQALHPDDPWLTRTAIDEVALYVNPAMTGFEWGSGRSTLWLARRLGTLVSVEHDPAWYAEVTRKIALAGLVNVDYRLVPKLGLKEYASQIERYPDSYFDIILIDGEDRNSCIRAAGSKIRIGGWIVIDNADIDYDFSPLSDFQLRKTSNGVWRTDLFIRR